jgi:hypothetical protein
MTTTTSIKSRLVSLGILDEGIHTYGITDKQGREVGYMWSICSMRYDALAGSELVDANEHRFFGYYNAPADKVGKVFYRMNGRPTRGRKGYGPAFNYNDFDTLEEARRHAVKRVEDARKRDTKKFAKEVAL